MNVIASSVSAVIIAVSVVLAGVVWQEPQEPVTSSSSEVETDRTADSVAEGQKVAIYFGDALPESRALSVVREAGLDALKSGYDTIWVDVKLMVPPTHRQLSRLRSADGVWSLAYDGDSLRDADSPMPAKRKRMLQRQWERGGICTLNRLQIGVASHFTEAQIRSLVRPLFTARIRSLQKPSNVIHVRIQSTEELEILETVSTHEDVEMIAYVHEL